MAATLHFLQAATTSSTSLLRIDQPMVKGAYPCCRTIDIAQTWPLSFSILIYPRIRGACNASKQFGLEVWTPRFAHRPFSTSYRPATATTLVLQGEAKKMCLRNSTLHCFGIWFGEISFAGFYEMILALLSAET